MTLEARTNAHLARGVADLDDRLENVAAGAARGWQAILHETPEKSRAAVEKAGLFNHR